MRTVGHYITQDSTAEQDPRPNIFLCNLYVLLQRLKLILNFAVNPTGDLDFTEPVGGTVSCTIVIETSGAL